MSLPPGIKSLPNGQWVLEHDSHLSRWAEEHGTIVSDPYLMKWLKPKLGRCKVVWDIGANIGDHTRQYLDWGMHVIAFEPHPTAFACLEWNCLEALCLNLAASDVNGSVNFVTNENVGASRIAEDGEWSVPAVRLDDLVAQGKIRSPNFVKIDIEGHEVRALAGMRNTIEEHRPIVFCEMNRDALAANGYAPADLFKFFAEYGYGEPELYPPGVSREDEQFDALFHQP